MLQIIYPEVLLTSICATILLVGIYVDFENPSIRRLTVYNDSMVEGFATMVENRDDNTGGHIRRTRAYVNLMMHKMRHAARGGEIILNTFKDIDNPEFQKIAYEVARFHHEKYNGKGYPDGLSGEQIPLHARVMAIADVFDAVSQKRCYREAMPIDQCFDIIAKGSGTDFDPYLTQMFLDSRAEIEQLMDRD